MTRLLVVNHSHSHVCGIHDLGLRIHRCLSASDKLDVDYAACSSAQEFSNLARDYDAVIVNHRDDLTPWAAIPLPIPKLAVLHQYEEATADARADALTNRFDWVLALDPCLKPNHPRLVSVGRPIPEHVMSRRHLRRAHDDNMPRIGSFGFAFPHKGFADVAQEIADQCDEAIYNLHMPEAYFNGAEGAPIYTDQILNDCAKRLNGEPGRELRATTTHLPEGDVIAMLAANVVNCLFYAPGQPDAGQSSALDYLIAASRPMLLSEASMFRSAWNAPRWPETRLGEVLRNYSYYQNTADRLYGWHHGRLVRDIEALMGRIL